MRTWPVIIFAAVVGLLIQCRSRRTTAARRSTPGRTVVLKGTVMEWLYSNPHCLLKLDVDGPDGKVGAVDRRGSGAECHFSGGYRRDSFKPGDQVTITVEPVKENQPMGRILEAVLANGTNLGRASSAGAIVE